MIEDFDNKKIQEFEYTKNINVDGEIIGTCELGTAEFQILNNTNEYSNLKGQWIKTIHGSFYIYDVAPVQEKINIKMSCYDIKYKLDTPYNKSLYSFPMTLKEWRNQIGNNCGVVFDNSDFPNSDLVLDSQPYVGENSSNRNVIQLIAKAGCSFVDNDEKDILYFNWFEDKIYKVDDWIELTTENKKSEPLNVVVLGRGNVEDNVYYPENLSENKVEFRIDNNYILDPQDTETTHDRRYDVIKPIYDRVNGFSYLIFKMRTQKMDNRLSIKLGQKISYFDIWENQLEAYVMAKTIKYLGGDATTDSNYEVTLSSSEIKESSTDYSYASSVENQILNVSRKADKNAGMIQDMVSKQVDLIDTKQGTGAIEFTINVDTTAFELKIRNACQYFKSKWLFKSKTKFLKGSWLRVTYEDKSYNRYKLPPLSLRQLNGAYDEMVIQSGKVSVIKRVGIDENNNLYLLPEEKVITYDDVLIQLKNGTNTIQLESFPEAVFDMTYMTDNLYTNTFATSAEVQALLEITVGKIMLEVSSKTSKEEVKSLIEASIGEYRLEVAKEITDSSDALSEDLNKKITKNSEDIETLNTNKIDETKANELIDNKTNEIDTKYQDAVNNINKEMETKIGEEDYTSAVIIGKINDDKSELLISADKLNLIATDILKILAKNGIDLTTYELTIDSLNFKVDKDGNVNCNNAIMNDATISGGALNLIDEGQGSSGNSNCKFKIVNKEDKNKYMVIYSDYMCFSSDFNNEKAGTTMLYNRGNYARLYLEGEKGSFDAGSTGINYGIPGGIMAFSVEPTGKTFIKDGSYENWSKSSLETLKKNITKYETSALEIVKKGDIYEFNYKDEEEGVKKQLGFIIGKNYNTPEELLSNEKTGINTFNMSSIMWKAIQEQQEQIEKLKDSLNIQQKDIEILKSKIKEMEENGI